MNDLFDMQAEPEPDEAPLAMKVSADLAEALKASDAAMEHAVAATLDTLVARTDAEMPIEPEQGLRLVSPRTEAELMPPDFVVPALAEFVPDARLKVVAEGFARAALAIDVKAEGGLRRADESLVMLRNSIKAVEACFEDPTAEAYRRHKRLTGMIGEWLEVPRSAVDTVARRLIDEQARLDRLAQEQKRADQAEADAKAKADAAAAAKAAEKAQQPPAVVEQLKQQAKTATAPPVAARTAAPLASTATSKTWKARFAGTPADADPNPDVKDLTDAQRLQILQLCKAVTDGKVPIVVFKTIDWAYLNKRAEAEKTALAIPGIEAFEHVAPKAKPGRRS